MPGADRTIVPPRQGIGLDLDPALAILVYSVVSLDPAPEQ